MNETSVAFKTSRLLVIGASGGIGHACAVAAGQICGTTNVTMLSRAADGFDITDEESVIKHLKALEGSYDGIIIATGGLETSGFKPEKSLRSISTSAFEAQFKLNAIGPALVLKHIGQHLPRDRPCLIATLSARVGSIGDNNLGGWISYRSAKAALNQIIRTASIEFTRTHPQSICVALHPGTVRTSLTKKYVGKNPAVFPATAAQNILSVLAGLTPNHTGQFFDWRGDRVDW
ncbi:MAG: SDR family NAD(P)-dependent oxidoreductase [Amylibacter sp.]|nr:SDR family NAD(P)-dependent oxidoreductase [Amylibacter sp.]